MSRSSVALVRWRDSRCRLQAALSLVFTRRRLADTPQYTPAPMQLCMQHDDNGRHRQQEFYQAPLVPHQQSFSRS